MVQVLNRIINGVECQGLACEGWVESPLKGADGNVEFLACFHRGIGGTLAPSASTDVDDTAGIDNVAPD